MQERAQRVICQSHSDTYEQLLRRVDIPSLYNRRLQDITALMSNMVLYLIAFPIYLSEKVLHNRCVRYIVTLYYHVLELHATANTLLDILGQSHGQN